MREGGEKRGAEIRGRAEATSSRVKQVNGAQTGGDSKHVRTLNAPNPRGGAGQPCGMVWVAGRVGGWRGDREMGERGHPWRGGEQEVWEQTLKHEILGKSEEVCV